MTLLLTDSLQSPSVWLWLVVTVVAVLLLAGSAGRRRVSLVETLREFVQRNQGPPAAKKLPAADPDDADPAS